MKIFKAFLWTLVVIGVYLAGIYIVSGTLSFNAVSEVFTDSKKLESAVQDSVLVLLLIFVLSAILLSFLSHLWRRFRWFGGLLFFGSTFTGVLLVLGLISFQDARLLRITSVLLATFVILLAMLSLISALTYNDYQRQINDKDSLQRLSVRNPESLIFATKARVNQVYLGPVSVVSYLVLLYFKLSYGDDVDTWNLDIPTHSLMFVMGLAISLFTIQRSKRRLLR